MLNCDCPFLCSLSPGAQRPWWPRDHMPSVLREPNSERLWWQHTESVVSGYRQGKSVILLNSLGNEWQVEHWYVKNAAVPSDRTAEWSSVPSGARIGNSTGKHLGRLFLHRTSLVTRSHLAVKLQCCSCHHWHISLFSWQFCCSCGVVCDMDSKEFGQIRYFIFLKA